MDKVTMADVAKKAGISKSTVSQFLNKRYEYMSDETKKKIEEAINQLGYQPNYIARSLKQKRTSMIGIIIANIMHRFSTEVSRAIEDYFNEHDIHTIFCNTDNDPLKEKKYIDMLRAKQVDGLIIFPTGQNVELYENMLKSGYPVVFMDRKVKDILIPAVKVNNFESAYSIIQHFIDYGHERIAIVTQPLTTSTRIDRVEGYKSAMLANGKEPQYIISTEVQQMKSELEKLFFGEQPPTALLAGNDLAFLEVLKFAKDHGLKVGSNFSLAVFDNIPFADLVDPPVTTIAQPSYEMGKKAAEMLLKLIKKEETDIQDVVYSCELLIKESSIMIRS
ncbi:LacI family DNA-binding transcriptional regulator [Paenibacillus macerans]|uniref:LacI family DNA-binding transcriptional regulator n=1 Tax=Paenibacillus macerans TaxID=44252 RepID=UPI00203F4DC0|nr:substrate-binding domain-containing protein [Paenibacillus macerans]MCM3697831.1 substrate-binding domain-containing protein [Paenibacillus macerans]